MSSGTENPILNSPYEAPDKHYLTLSNGTLDYSKVVKGRRSFDPKLNTPIPLKSGSQGKLFSNQEVESTDNHKINILRREISSWRVANYPNMTRVMKELLLYWFENENRVPQKKLFLAQREAIETAIWLNEVTDKVNWTKKPLTDCMVFSRTLSQQLKVRR